MPILVVPDREHPTAIDLRDERPDRWNHKARARSNIVRGKSFAHRALLTRWPFGRASANDPEGQGRPAAALERA